MNFLAKVLISFLLVVSIASCGGGGGDGEGEGLPPPPPTGSIEGNAVDALIVNGNITIYAYDDGEKGELLGQTTTDNRGFYSLSIQSSLSRPILIELTGGSYIEETSSISVTLKDTHKLRAITFFEAGSPVKVMVTPWTNLAFKLFEQNVSEGEGITNAIAIANSAVSGLLGLNILSTFPANITDPSNEESVLTDSLLYGFYAAAVSQLTHDISIENNRSPHTTYTSIEFADILYRDVTNDGFLNGNDGANLGMGVRSFSAHTYRRDIAAAIIKVVNNTDINKTGLTVDDVLAAAQAYSESSDPIFGGAAPQSIDAVGPTITSNHPEGTTFAGIFDYSVIIYDPLGLASARFEINDNDIGAASDINNPKTTIDSSTYNDGEHVLSVIATDAIGNINTESFSFNIDNSAPVIQITSSLLTNDLDYQITGTIQDQTAGDFEVTVAGVNATVSQDNTWFANITLVGGENNLTVDIVDSFGNESSQNVLIQVDLFSPVFEEIYSDAVFLTNADTLVTETLLDHNYDNSKLYINFTNASLNNTPVTEFDLGLADIPFIGVEVEDLVGDGVFSESENITVEYSFSIENQIVVPLSGLSAQADSDRYIVPLVTEFLGDDWLSSSINDVGALRLLISDEAGNQENFNYEIKTFIDVPTVEINGLFNGADIEVFDYSTGALGGLVTSCSTSANGECSLPILTSDNYFLIRVSGGSYKEITEGSNLDVNTPIDFLVNFTNEDISIYLTPLSAFQSSFAFNELAAGSELLAAYTYAEEAMTTMFGFIPLLTPIAEDLNSLTLDDATKHRLALAGWSTMAVESGNDRELYNSLTLLDAFIEDLTSNGILDGLGTEGIITFGTMTLEANTYRAALSRFIYGYAIDNGYSDDLLNNLTAYVIYISDNTHASFDGAENESFDSNAPVIGESSQNNSVQAGVFDFAVSVTDTNAIAQVSFEVDNVNVGNAINVNDPTISIDTIDFEDGSRTITVTATDELGNIGSKDFTVDFDNTVPTIADNSLTNSWQSGTMTFNTDSSDEHLVSITVDVDGAVVGNVSDLANQVIDIVTTSYSDGIRQVGVMAVDSVGNEFYRQFAINFDNTAPVLTLDSSSLVNDFSYTISGTHTETGSGIESITIDDVNAGVNTTSWALAINLADLHNVLDVVITDVAGNSTAYEHIVDVDNLPPNFTPSYRDGRFETTSPTEFDWLTLGRLTNAGVTETLVYHNDHMTTTLPTTSWSAFEFNQIGQSDDYEKIMFFDMAIADNTGSGVFSDAGDLIMEYRYLRNGSVIKNWVNAIKVNDGLAIFPLTSDLLDVSYEEVTPTDVNRLEIRLTDEAGNVASNSYEWFVNILVPDLVVTSTESPISTFNGLNWNSRSGASNRNDEVVVATFTNDSNKSIQVKIDEDNDGAVSQVYESGERFHQVNVAKGDEWRTKNITRQHVVINEINSNRYSCITTSTWTEGVSTVSLCNDSACSSSQSYSAANQPSAVVNLESDDLSSLTVVNAWTAKTDITPFSGRSQTSYTREDDIPGELIERWDYIYSSSSLSGTSCPSGSYVGWEERYKETPTSVNGYPRNEYSDLGDTKTISAIAMEVVNQNGTVLTAQDSWYTIAANETVTIKVNYFLPALTFYTDSAVGDRGSFNSYSEKFYDKSFDWQFGIDLLITSVLDAGSSSGQIYTTKTTVHTKTVNHLLVR